MINGNKKSLTSIEKINDNRRLMREKLTKVIRPKSRAPALPKKVRQTDKQFFFFKKTFEIAIYATKFLSTIQKQKKTFKEPLKQLGYGPTIRWRDGPTD